MRSGFNWKNEKDKESPKKTPDVPFQMACRLHGILKSNSMIARSARAPSMKTWADQFRMLRKYAPDEEIEATLTWLSRNIKHEYCPRIYSAKLFRMKYDSLQEARLRGDKTPLFKEPVTEEALKIAARFDDMNWPTTERELIPQFVQISLINYRIFDTALKTLYYELKLESEKKNKEHPGLVKSKDWTDTKTVQFLVDMLPGAGTIIQTWLGNANFMAWKYPNWNGDLLRCAFHYEHERFQIMMARFVSDWKGDGIDWKRIWPMIKSKIPDSKGKETQK